MLSIALWPCEAQCSSIDYCVPAKRGHRHACVCVLDGYIPSGGVSWFHSLGCAFMRGLCMQDEQEAVGRLIQYMQAVQGQQLWPSEDSSLSRPHPGSAAALQHLVESLVRGLVTLLHSTAS